MKFLAIVIMGFLFVARAEACRDRARSSTVESTPAEYVWTRVADQASFPEAYNYPVFTFGDWMVAMNNGAWLSTDGKRWLRTDLPDSGLNSGYQKYIQFQGYIYALGTMTGNYENLHLTTKVVRTNDFRNWETVARASNLPKRVFYGAAVYKNKMWLVGGYDGRQFHNDVWNSADGVHWRCVVKNAAWSARGTKLLVFKDKLWLIGGGVIDGQKDPNPQAQDEIWSSTDGVEWSRVETTAPGKWAGTPVVFDGKLWLIGANRNDGSFSNALWVSTDGRNWQRHSAPWSPRGGVAVWEFERKLFMTGGKFSETADGAIKFIYSNDVWAMAKRTHVESF